MIIEAYCRIFVVEKSVSDLSAVLLPVLDDDDADDEDDDDDVDDDDDDDVCCVSNCNTLHMNNEKKK